MKCAEPNLLVLFSELEVIKEPNPMAPDSETFTSWILDLESTLSKNAWSSKQFQLLKEKFWLVFQKADLQDALYQLLDAIIQCLGTRVPDEQIDIVVEWIWACGLITFDDCYYYNPVHMMSFISKVYIDDTKPEDTHKQRNLCIALSLMARRLHELHKEYPLPDEIWRFLSLTLEPPEPESRILSTKLYAVICLESFALNHGKHIPADLIDKLTTLSQVGSSTQEPLARQLRFCAQHLLFHLKKSSEHQQQSEITNDNYREIFTRSDQSVHIKLSSDTFTARSDWRTQGFQYSCYQTKADQVYYYEVTLLTGGPMRLGWSSQKTPRQNNFHGVIGANSSSIGFDGYRKWVWFDNRSHPVQPESGPRWNAGDVVGCLLDLTSRKQHKPVVFYVNGKEATTEPDLDELFLNYGLYKRPYSPAISLGFHQQCEVNLGAKPFKFLPHLAEMLPISDFHTEALKARELSQERITEFYRNHFLQQVDKPISSAQLEFDKWLLELEDRIAEDFDSLNYNWSYFHSECPDNFRALIDQNDPNSWSHLISSMSQVMGTKLGPDYAKIDILLGWMASCIAPLLDSLSLADFTKLIRHHIEDSNEPEPAKQRNLLMILLILSHKFDLIASIDVVVNFLVGVFLHEPGEEEELNSVNKLLALICLEPILIEKNIPQAKDISQELERVAMEFYGKYSAGERIKEMYKQESGNSVDFQIGFLAQWILDKLSRSEMNGKGSASKSESNDEPINENETKEAAEESESPSPTDLKSQASLDLIWHTEDLKLSRDNLSLRNDSSEWQRICYRYPFESGIYFYEVILLTSGPMRIGWATRATTDDEEQVDYSISFDGHHRLLTFQSEVYPLIDQCRWKAGDVVGCLVEIDQKERNLVVIFYLNSQRIYRKFRDVHLKAYYPAICLSAHQQCSVNFGQAPFEHPVNTEDLSENGPLPNVTMSSPVFCQWCHIKPHTLQFSYCNHWRFCLECAPKIGHCPTCAKKE